MRTVPTFLRGARVPVSCPSWCVTDHADEDHAFIEDVSHEGARIAMQVPLYGSGTESTLICYLMQWPFSRDPEPRLALSSTDDGAVASLPSAAALAFADQVVAHAETIRQQARVLAGAE